MTKSLIMTIEMNYDISQEKLNQIDVLMHNEKEIHYYYYSCIRDVQSMQLH